MSRRDSGADLDAVLLPDDARITLKAQPRLLGGVSTLHTRGRREQPFSGGLYRTTQTNERTVPLTFVPYYAWDNRKPGAMAVWVRSAR